jgi:hypothetical protein
MKITSLIYLAVVYANIIVMALSVFSAVLFRFECNKTAIAMIMIALILAGTRYMISEEDYR